MIAGRITKCAGRNGYMCLVRALGRRAYCYGTTRMDALNRAWKACELPIYSDGTMKNPYKPGEKVLNKTDGLRYTVYQVYDENYLSLSLYDYPDVEQDFIIHISEVEHLSNI